MYLDVTKALQALHDSEINFFIIGDWDGGFLVGLGQGPDECIFKTTKSKFIDACYWLVDKALSEYPQSKFYREYPVNVRAVATNERN